MDMLLFSHKIVLDLFYFFVIFMGGDRVRT